MADNAGQIRKKTRWIRSTCRHEVNLFYLLRHSESVLQHSKWFCSTNRHKVNLFYRTQGVSLFSPTQDEFVFTRSIPVLTDTRKILPATIQPKGLFNHTPMEFVLPGTCRVGDAKKSELVYQKPLIWSKGLLDIYKFDLVEKVNSVSHESGLLEA